LSEPEAAVPRAWRATSQRNCYALGHDRAWLDRAIASAREATGQDSGRAEPYRILGMVLTLDGNPSGAQVALARACALNPNDDDAYARLGRSYAQLGQPEKERDTYLATISPRPDCWQPYVSLATWRIRSGQVEQL